MTAAYEEVPFSELLHHPAATAERLKAVRALRLRRRGAADLALISVDQLEEDTAVVGFTAAVLNSLLRSGKRQVIQEVLPDALPWAVFLPAVDQDMMLDELVNVARGAAGIDNLRPLATLLTQWRHSAEVYADPELHRLVTREVVPDADLPPVPRPGE
jgi:hypothetical protein